MMITRPEKNLFVSDAGFSVEVLGRTGMLYREGERVMKVGSEAGRCQGATCVSST